MDVFFQILLRIIWILSILFSVYGLYQVCIMLIGLMPEKHVHAPSKPKYRFLVLIVARNEAPVIGYLIDSLDKQNYPRELYDILVMPNNCSDNTALVALEHGARILDCSQRIRSKGEALSYAIKKMPSDLAFDAYINFDADNVVHPDFLLQMNHALCHGATVAQGYRDSKNPYDTYNSGCWAINYWLSGRLFNHPRSLLKMSSLVTGTGIMIRKSVIDKLGGWNTITLADDFELNVQCILAGEKVSWVPDAITYDEQSLTFSQTWKQRKRWLIGFIQTLAIYLKPLFSRVIKTRKMADLDILLYCLFLPVQYCSIIIYPLGVILRLIALRYPLFPLTPLYDQFLPSIIMAVVLPILTAFIVAIIERKIHWPLLKSIIMFPLYVAAIIPISILSLFVYKKNFQWDEIKHTRAISIDDIKSSDN
jgi:cellulose synthase/poly-beta-1,6-N-acetylglucosamine synthase-like glycosyltransferase